jgi:hypothetical protein
MMNRALLQGQMFANGGAAVPNEFKGFSKLPEDVQMKMNPALAKKYEEGGDVTQGFDPANPYNVAKFFRDNPGTTVSDYNNYFGTNLDPKEFGIFEKPKPMEEGGVAGLMSQPDMAAMPMGSTQEAVDPAVLETALQGASEEVGDLEQAGDFKSMMDQFSGEEKSEEERRDDLASIVGQEDAAQTPDSVLALVTPVVQISMLDQGIAPMAQEAMDTPVEGDMAGGIMSMTGAGNEPPVNFNQGGEVLRRGDEDPVQFFKVGGVAPMTDYQQKVGETAQALLPTFQQFMPTTDPDVAKQRLQSDILFDIANTALAFSAPMEGERPGLSAAERLALATQKTQLLPKIQQRTAKSAAEQKAQETAIKSGALQAALGMETARLKQVGAERVTSLKEAQENARTVKTLDFKRKEGVNERTHKTALANQETQLKMALQVLEGKQDLASISAKATYEDALQKLKGQQKINELGIEQENKLEQINKEIIGRKDLAKINNIASMEEVIKKIESTEGIEAAKITSRELIATEKNNTDRLINQNNIAQKDRRLKLDKVRESNLVADRQAKNQQAIAELDLKKVTEARQTLEGLRDFELRKEAGLRDEKKLALLEKELNEVKIAETEIKRFTAENRAENDAAVLEFKNKELNKLVEYRNTSNNLKAELNQITRSNNVVNQQLKEKEITLKTHKAQLETFGTGLEGRTLNIVTDAKRFTAYADGANDPQFETAIQNYVAKTTDIKGETTEKELPPYLQDVLKQRLQKGLTIPNIPLSKLNLSKAEMEAFGPISEEKGNAAVTKIIDPNVDLTDATGFVSSLKSGMRFLAGQASEIGVGSGDVFKETSAGRKMLNALANSTERFIREATNDRLDVQSLARLQKELVRPSGFRTDADALSQLEVTRNVMQKTKEELQDIIDNPKKYRDVSLDKARKAITLTSGLIDEYGTAINSYKRFGGFREQGGGSEQLFKNIIKKRKTN